MIPEVIKATQFQFITVKDVTFSRNKPFWFNINYTVTSTGKSKQKMKRFLSKAECRKNSWFTKKYLGTAKGIAVLVRSLPE